ncbi:MAG: glutaminase, partial [Plesiomonas shigelloides]
DTNFRNRGIANVLQGYGRLGSDPMVATDLYTRQCALNVSARDLAVMGATLADGGVNPLTKERVVDNDVCHYTLAVMVTAGLYETSGDWLYDIGLPGKSGIGGGIVTVSPGKGGLGTFAPLLDSAGNSVKGQLAARFLSRTLGMDMFVSEPYIDKTIDKG